MAIQTVLVPVEAGEFLRSILGTTLQLVRHCQCYVEGVPLGIRFADFVPGIAPMGEVIVSAEPPTQKPSSEDLQELFVSFMRDHGVPHVGGPQEGLSFGWLAGDLVTDSFIAEYSRVFDVTVVGRPHRSTQGPRVTTLEAVLFEGGRPVLIAPPNSRTNPYETILIAWNSSTEAARAVSFAMPLLEVAKKVIVLTVEGANLPGPTGKQLCANLRAHSIQAENLSVMPKEQSTGEIILSQAEVLNCDLVVKGAYTQSRLRQMIFGGATTHLLYHANFPVFMSI